MMTLLHLLPVVVLQSCRRIMPRQACTLAVHGCLALRPLLQPRLKRQAGWTTRRCLRSGQQPCAQLAPLLHRYACMRVWTRGQHPPPFPMERMGVVPSRVVTGNCARDCQQQLGGRTDRGSAAAAAAAGRRRRAQHAGADSIAAPPRRHARLHGCRLECHGLQEHGVKRGSSARKASKQASNDSACMLLRVS